MPDIVVICGATASGKTAMSLSLANFIDIEIISADSRQVYKMLDIGTAKPSPEELNKVKHYFIDFLDLEETYSAGVYGQDAYLQVRKIKESSKIPVVVGGSGLYIKSLCEGLFEEVIDKKKLEVRAELELELEKFGIDKLYQELEKIDIDSFKLYSDKNPRRIIRAIEHYRSTGIAFSVAQKEFAINRNLRPIYFAIEFDREELYNRINQRVEKMWEMGLVFETEKILSLGYSKTLNSLNTVGYKEVIKYLDGEFTKDIAISELKKNTRHYAKRQITWFRKIPNIRFVKPDKLISEIINALN